MSDSINPVAHPPMAHNPMQGSDMPSVSRVSHENVKEEVHHYTIFTKKWNNYFANGLLSGNRNTPNMKLGK